MEDTHGNIFLNTEQHISILFLPHKRYILVCYFKWVCTPFNLQSLHCGAL